MAEGNILMPLLLSSWYFIVHQSSTLFHMNQHSLTTWSLFNNSELILIVDFLNASLCSWSEFDSRVQRLYQLYFYSSSHFSYYWQLQEAWKIRTWSPNSSPGLGAEKYLLFNHFTTQHIFSSAAVRDTEESVRAFIRK